MLSLTSAKSGALIGVLISVTTIPAAANIGVAAAFGDWPEWRGAMAAARRQPDRRSCSPASAPCSSSAASTCAAGAPISTTSARPRRGCRWAAAGGSAARPTRPPDPNEPHGHDLLLLAAPSPSATAIAAALGAANFGTALGVRPALLRRDAGLGPAAALTALGEQQLGQRAGRRRWSP